MKSKLGGCKYADICFGGFNKWTMEERTPWLTSGGRSKDLQMLYDNLVIWDALS